jgi:hypothetical protein
MRKAMFRVREWRKCIRVFWGRELRTMYYSTSEYSSNDREMGALLFRALLISPRAENAAVACSRAVQCWDDVLIR